MKTSRMAAAMAICVIWPAFLGGAIADVPAISVASRFYHDRHFVRLNLLVTLIEPVRLPSGQSLMHSCKQLLPLEPTRPMGRLYDVSSGILGLAAVVPKMVEHAMVVRMVGPRPQPPCWS